MNLLPISTKVQKANEEMMNENRGNLIEYIRNSEIGKNNTFITPFGTLQAIYADYTATGRSLTFIEDFINSQILPFYANTHSHSAWYADQTSLFREEARTIIKRITNSSEEDILIFTGNGSTSAINLLVNCLNLKYYSDCSDQKQKPTNDFVELFKNRFGSFECNICRKAFANYSLADSHIEKEHKDQKHSIVVDPKLLKPVIFLSMAEHNSNILPWRDTGSIIEFIPLNKDNILNLIDLEEYFNKGNCTNIKIILSKLDALVQLQMLQEKFVKLMKYLIYCINIMHIHVLIMQL